MTWHSDTQNLPTTYDVHPGVVRWEVLALGETNGVVQDQEIMMLEVRLVVLVVPAVNQQCQIEPSIQNNRKN